LRIKQSVSLLCIKVSQENLVENSLSPPRHYLCQLFLQLLDFGLLLCIDLRLNKKMGAKNVIKPKSKKCSLLVILYLIHFTKIFVSPYKFQDTKMLLGKSAPILLTSG